MMISLDASGQTSQELSELGYIQVRTPMFKPLLRLTRWWRAKQAVKFIEPKESHLDIGCGDGYFLRMSPCRVRIGLDKALGDHVVDSLNFPDNHFDFVTMLAVIEHLKQPEALVKDIHRVLKPNGRFIVTTPKRSAEVIINSYAREIDEEHESYFDRARFEALQRYGFELNHYETFIFGLNQIACLEKASPKVERIS
jgi:SAM-dependent methyltransferase